MSEPSSLAIIGISCLFPKADKLQAYWSNIKNGVDAIAPIPERTAWKIDDYFDPDPKAPDRTYARRGGFLSPIDFNPMEFGVSPKDIEATDTTQLLGMVAAKQAIQDAGYADKPFNRDRTSVILGVTGALELVIPLGARLGHPVWRRALKEAGVAGPVAEDVVQRISDSYVGWQENSFPGLLGNVVAGRIASRLDLGGTNCVVDAACASSLAALHLACMELSAGRSDMVITGGLDTFNDIFMYMCFSKTPALSPSGDAKPFDRDCDGTILGEGLGILVLKRLADAERDGDRIYAVVKGIGSSSDGRGNAIYAPRADGQKQALERAYENARANPSTIELIEAHGTGTKVGDATELKALTEVYRGACAEGSWAALGSVKSQIGHTKAAAGVAGLIKAALSLHHKVLPPTIKVTQPVEEAAPGRSPFYINTQKRPWLPREDHPRRAGVSSFGFGGTNFHCVLEEHGSQRADVGWDGDVEIVALSGGTREELRARLAAFPAEKPWGEIRTAARESRAAFHAKAAYRLLLPASQTAPFATLRDAALTMLEKNPERTSWVLPSGVAFGSGARLGKLGALFPGQGSQYAGMLRDLACQFPGMLNALAAANQVFARSRPEPGLQRLSDFIYPLPVFSDDARRAQEEALKATDVAQPALGAVSLGALSVLTYFGVTPEAAAGHSYGELTALCGAGCLQPESLHELSNVRGQLMANRNGHSDRGAMLAVQASEEAVARFVAAESSGLVIANRNSPGQFVLAGPKARIEHAAAEFAKQSIRTRLLPVSAAFHSALVADAHAPFAAFLKGVQFNPGHIPVYANSTAQAYPNGAGEARDLLAGQIVKTVDFMAQIETMFKDGVTTFLELGPGHVLSDLVQSILQGREVETIALDSSRGTRSGTFDLAVMLCRLASLGHAVELSRWEEATETRASGSNGKGSLTVPVCGANSRSPRPQRPPAAPAPASGSPASETLTLRRVAPLPINPQSAVMPSESLSPVAFTPPHRALPSELAAALQVAQQGILSLQQMQEQTARLHQQFLEGQESARRTLEALLTQRRELLTPSHPSALSTLSPALPIAMPFACATPAVSQPPAPLPAPAQEATVRAPAAEAPTPAPKAGASVAIAQAVLEVVAEKTGYPSEMLELTMGLDSDLGIDSIKRVEIMASLRGRLPDAPEVKPEHLGALRTLQEVVNFLSGGKDPGSPSAEARSVSVGYARASEVLLAVVAEKTGYPVEMLNLDMGLDSDLGVDSIKRVEIMAAIRTGMPEAPEIKPEHLGTLQTLKQVVEFLTAQPGGEASPAPADPVGPVVSEALVAPEPPVVNEPVYPELRRQLVRPTQLSTPDQRATVVLPPGAPIWVTEDGSDLAACVEGCLRSRGYSVRRGMPSELIARGGDERPSGLVVLWPATPSGSPYLKEIFRLIQTVGPALRSAGNNGGGVLVTVSRLDGVFGFGTLNGKGDPISGGLAGLVKTAHHEWPEVHCKALDLDPEACTSAEASAQIVEEMLRVGPVEVGLFGAKRFGLSVETAPFAGNGAEPLLNRGDVVVVSGGARGITAETALQLARAHLPHLVLLGRSQLAESEPEWLAGMVKEAEIKQTLLARSNGDRSPKLIEARYREVLAQREIRGHLSRIRAEGATALYRAVDVRNSDEVRKVLDEVREKLGPIRGLIHGAGVLADRRIEDKTEAQFELVYGTKVAGLKNLLAAVAKDDLKLLALFSSYTGRFGRTGQVDYAAANEVLNKIAQVESRRRPCCRVVSFNWGPWNGGMVSSGLRKIFEQEGVGLIEPEVGARFFVRELSSHGKDSVEVLAMAPPPVQEGPAVAPDAPSQSVAFESEVSLGALPCLASHVLNGRAVLPTALMIEWLGHGAVHGNPGMAFNGFENFKVLKGLVIEPGGRPTVSVLAEAGQTREGLLSVAVQLVSQSAGRQVIHARADVMLAEGLPSAPPSAMLAPAPHTNDGCGTKSVYETGLLFHGPHFHGIEFVETCSELEISALVKAAPAPKRWIQHPLRPSWLADPMALDCSFQMMILWSYEHRQGASLPCAIKRYRQFKPAFPKNGTRVVIRITSARSPLLTADIHFLDRKGNLIAFAEGYECVVDPGLKDAFRLNRLKLEQ